MKESFFILVIGHARSGTSLTCGLLNLSPDVNIGFEENSDILWGISSAIPEKTKLSYDFNGNKISLASRYYVTSEKIIDFFKKRIVLFHDRFTDLKVIFLNRNPIDTIASNYLRRKLSGKSKDKGVTITGAVNTWIANQYVFLDLKDFFKDYIEIKFENLIFDDETKKELFQYVGCYFEEGFLNKEINVPIYGKSLITRNKLTFSHDKYNEVKKEIADELVRSL